MLTECTTTVIHTLGWRHLNEEEVPLGETHMSFWEVITSTIASFESNAQLVCVLWPTAVELITELNVFQWNRTQSNIYSCFPPLHRGTFVSNVWKRIELLLSCHETPNRNSNWVNKNRMRNFLCEGWTAHDLDITKVLDFPPIFLQNLSWSLPKKMVQDRISFFFFFFL